MAGTLGPLFTAKHIATHTDTHRDTCTSMHGFILGGLLESPRRPEATILSHLGWHLSART